MANEQHRHDISDKKWALLEPHLPGQQGQWGVSQRQPLVYKRGVLDFADRCAVAGFAPILWKMGKRPSTLSSLA